MMVVCEVQLMPAGFPKQGKQRQRVVKRLEKDQAYFNFYLIFPLNILVPRALLIGGLVIMGKPFPADAQTDSCSLLILSRF